jgi:hypothetical protein
MGGRTKGQQNALSRNVREQIIAGLNAAGGGNMANYVTRVALADHRLGVAMMSLVCPKAIEANIRHEEQVFVSVEDLDRSLTEAGLPPTKEIFALDYGPREQDEEAEVVVAEAKGDAT